MSHARHSLTALALFTVVATACGGAAAPVPTPVPSIAAVVPSRSAVPATAAPAAGTSATPAAPAIAGALTWTLGVDSKVTIRVREQLAQVPAPSDAVLASTLTGGFTLNPDGTFGAASKLTGDVAGLRSDRDSRDQFVKRSTLDTARFPTAAFVPTRSSGLVMPLAAAGEFSFKLTGKMTIRGVEKEVTFDVKAKRSGAELTASATLNPTVKFGDFGMTPPAAPVVLSVIDEIRMDIQLVGTEAK